MQQTTLEGLPRPAAVTKDDPSFKFEITVSADEEACGGYVLADVCVSSPNDGSALTQTPGSFLESSKTWMYSVDGSHLRRAGRYDVSVSAYDDVDDTWWPVIGSPASFVITPAPASSGSSTLGQPSGSGGLSNPAGLIVTVPVTLLDVYGNQRVPTPGELAVNFVSIPGGAIVVGSVSSDAGTQLTTASAHADRRDAYTHGGGADQRGVGHRFQRVHAAHGRGPRGAIRKPGVGLWFVVARSRRGDEGNQCPPPRLVR